MNSPRFKINWLDLWKSFRGFLITLLAVAVTAVFAHITQEYVNWSYNICIPNIPCIDLRFLAMPAIGGLLELGRRWVSDLSKGGGEIENL